MEEQKKQRISKEVARSKYGIVVKRFHDYKYYLLENGNVVDSDGDVRYIAPKNRIPCPLCGIQLSHEQRGKTHMYFCEACPFVGLEFWHDEDVDVLSFRLKKA